MRRIVVTPAGRRRYLEILAGHLSAQKTDFDEWHLWQNTCIAEDVHFIAELEAKYPDWVRVIRLPEAVTEISNMNIHKFFPLDAADPGCMYLRLDDDIVWLEPGFVKSMFDARSSDTDHFLVYANIVNNAVISHIQQRFGNITYGAPAGYECMDPVGWGDPAFAEQVHRSFLRDLRSSCDPGAALCTWKFPRWILHHYERVSINCVSWRGSDFADFGGRVGADEEQWLACDKPKQLGRCNVIYGGAVCVHFAFYTQRQRMDGSNILGEYADICP